MEAFTVTTKLDLSDWKVLVRQVQQRAWRRAGPMPGRFLALFVWAWVFAWLVWAMWRWPGEFSPGSMAIGVLMFGSLLWILMARHRRGLRPSPDSRMLETTVYDFRPDGFEVRRPDIVSRCQWTLIRDIARTPGHIFLWLDFATAYVIRIADLPASITADQAMARLRDAVGGMVPGKENRENSRLPPPAG
jgi:hypothetical protein